MSNRDEIKLFMVDDNYIFRTAASILMKQYGFNSQVEEFENGQEALDTLRALAEKGDALPKVIFLDLKMPIMTGWEFLEAVKNENPRITNECGIYILTSSIDYLDYDASTKYDFIKGYITKPLSRYDLEKIMKELQPVNY